MIKDYCDLHYSTRAEFILFIYLFINFFLVERGRGEGVGCWGHFCGFMTQVFFVFEIPNNTHAVCSTHGGGGGGYPTPFSGLYRYVRP